MIVHSKFVVGEFVPRVLGPFDAVDYTCYEAGHTWDSSCVSTWIGIFRGGMIYSLKLYTTFYLLGAVWKLMSKETDKKKLAKNIFLSILRSSVFLASNAASFIFFICAYRKIFGKFHGVFAAIAGFASSFFSLMLEKKSRRGLLAIYVMNHAIESVFNMAVSRGYVTPIKNGQMYLFALTNLAYMSLFRGSSLPPYIQNLFEKVLGSEESKIPRAAVNQRQNQVVNPQSQMQQSLMKAYKYLMNLLNAVGPRVPACQHQDSCSAYMAKSAIKYFSIGYVLQVLLNYRNIFRAFVQRKASLLVKSLSNFQLAKFMCAYVSLFRILNCLLRWLFGRDHPEIFGGIAGFFAGLSSKFFPNISITMYAFAKLLDIFCMKAVAHNWLPYFPNFDILVYSLSLGVLFHDALFEPQNIRPSYWSFLKGLSGNHFPLIFRKLLDKYGTKASKFYPNFVPNLDPKNVKTAEVKQILLLHGKWP
ncbi:transmembrane protein 135-like [Styela clava]